MQYFKLDEFKCKCGCGQNKINNKLLDLLDSARDEAKTPFIITSGYRCPEHNKAVNGVKNSSHVKGYAADIAINQSNKDTILNACKKYFSRIGIAKTFIHVDCDPDKSSPAIWYYD